MTKILNHVIIALALATVVLCGWILLQPEEDYVPMHKMTTIPEGEMLEVLRNAPEGIFSIDEEYEKLIANREIAEKTIPQDIIKQDVIEETIIYEESTQQVHAYKNIQLSDEEFEEFCRMVEAEVTGDKPSDFPVSCTETHIWWAKLRCARVILNRISDDEFPDTMHAVLHQKGQFAPLSDGRYYDVEVTEMTRDACRAALDVSQHDDVPDALYFRMGKWHTASSKRGFIKTDKLGISYYSQI